MPATRALADFLNAAADGDDHGQIAAVPNGVAQENPVVGQRNP